MTTVRKDYIRPVDFKHGVVDMSHGDGGQGHASQPTCQTTVF